MPARAVRRRHVFYISGFDPKGAAHYHRLYAEEAAKSAQINGYGVQVGKRRRAGEHAAAWSVVWSREPAHRDADTPTPVHTDIEFLRWDDIVRDHWPKNAAVLARDQLVTTWLYLRTGALWRMLKLAWPPVVAVTTPSLVLMALAAAPLLSIVAGLAMWGAGAPAVGAALAALLLTGAIFALARLAERRMNMQWLVRSFAFTGRQGTRGWPALEARLDAFAERIVQRVNQPDDPCDEVLLVAHSSGSIMASIALARALALDPQLARRGPRLSFLTLGQWSPLLSSLPTAQRFRAELARLGAEPDLDWVDFTAPPDGCCFALTDPVTGAGLPRSRPDHPRLLSPRFAEMFSAEGYAAIRRDRFRLHFQYLMAAEKPGDYDYTLITAGPLTLGERFAGRASTDGFARFRVFG